MPEPVAELTLALLGDPASFERMMAAAEARLDKFVGAVDAKGRQIQESVDRMLGNVSASASKLDSALQPVVAAWGDVAMSASVAKESVADASKELRGVKDPAGEAARSLKGVGDAGAAAGKAVKGGMEVTQSTVGGASKKLEGFAALVGRLRTAANKPIIQRVTVQRTGGAAVGAGRGGTGREGLTSAGYGLMTAGGAILGAEAEMIKSGEGTEDALRRLYATAGETQNYETLRREVLSVATEFGQMPEEVAKALYPIESLGFKGAEGLKVLRASAAMAKGTQADLGLTSELVAKTLNLYGQGADHAAHLTDVFTVAIKDAVVPGKDFVPAYSSVMTIAKSAGLSVEETAAALAVMTHNAKSAAVGATQLRAFISGVITPTKAMRDAAKAAGLEWLATGHGADELKRVGLAGVLDEVMRATNGNVSALGKLLPDMRKNQAAMALLNNGGQVFTRTLKDVQNSQGATAKAGKEMDQSLAQSGRNMDAALGAASSSLETAMKPVLLTIYTEATNVLNAFNRLSPATQKAIGWIAGVTGAVLLLGGAGLVVTRWVLSVQALFATFAARGVAANAAVTVAATETAGAEASIGVAGEASAAQLQAAATGMMTANEEVAATAEGAAAAEATVGTAATGAAAAGVAAFAVGAAWFVGITAAVALVAGLAYEWWLVKQAQDDATKAQQRFNDAASRMQSEGGQAALMGTRAKVLSESDDLTEAVRMANADPVNLTQFQKDMEVREQLGLKGYNTSSHSYNSVEGAQTRIKALDADAAKLSEAILQAHKDGVNVNTKAAHASGADGFALAVANVDPKSIVTDAVGQTCANFVSKVFMKAGLALDKPINRASDLRDKIVKMGGQEHGGPALPGDLVFYSGPAFTRRRDGSKGSGHVAYADGAGGDWESTHGQTSHKSIAGNLAWAAKHGGGTAQFYTVPGSTFSNPPPETPPVSGGAEPDWAKHLHDGKAKGATPSPGSLADIDLKPLDRVLPLGDLNGSRTDAGNYEEKLHRLDDALADHDARVRESGKGYDRYALKLADLAQRLVLAENAVRNTGQAIGDLSPKVTAGEGKAEASRRTLNGLSDRMKGQKSAGLPKSDPAAWAKEVRQHEALRAQYNADLAVYRRDDAALKENRRVHAQALEDKDRVQGEADAARAEQEQKATERFLKAQSLAVKLGPDGGGISRDSYDESLKDALAGKNKAVGRMNPQGDDYARVQDALTQSQIARQAASQKVSRETLQLQKHDFDALQQDLSDEAQAYRDAGVTEADIAVWRNLKQHELDTARTAQSRKDLIDGGKEMLDLGLETAAQYQNQLGQAVLSLQADWAKAETDAERQGLALQIAKLRLEIGKIDWDAAAQKADGWKQAVDTGKLSTEEYVLRLKDLQSQIPATAEEYKRLTSEIDAANKAMYDKAEQQAGAAASKATDQLMAVMQKAKTLKEAIRDSLKEAATDAVHKTIEDAIKKQVLKIVLDAQADKMKKAAEAHKKAGEALAKSSEGDKMTAAAAVHARATDLFNRSVTFMGGTVTTMGQGIQTFGQWVTQFADAVNSAASQAPAAGQTAPAGAGGAKAAPLSGDGRTFSAPGVSVQGMGRGASGGQTAGGGSGAGGGQMTAADFSVVAAATADLRQKGSVGGDTALLNDVGTLTRDKSSNAVTAGLGDVQQAAGLASSVASVSKWAQLSQGLGAVMPYVGLALAAASLFGPHKGYAPTRVQDQRYAGVLTSFSPIIDSGYSGADGLRTLLGPVSRAQAGVGTQGQAGGHVLQINIAAGAFTGVSDPVAHGTKIVQTIQDQMARMSALDNASRGEG